MSVVQRTKQKSDTFSICACHPCAGANLLCIVPILSYETAFTPLDTQCLTRRVDNRCFEDALCKRTVTFCVEKSGSIAKSAYLRECSGGVVVYHAILTHWRSLVRSSPRIFWTFWYVKKKKGGRSSRAL